MLKADQTCRQANLVTAVITSCGRQDLLDTTLETFFSTNTYMPLDVIVIEDGDLRRNAKLAIKYKQRPITWIATGRRMGQIEAVKLAYSRVSTPYIFHCEDDWKFHSRYYIEKSLKILQQRADCLLVQIRAPSDLNGHPLAATVEFIDGIPVRKLLANHRVDGLGGTYLWQGFSFNPGLRRLLDYQRIGGYSFFKGESALRTEEAIGNHYSKLGYYALVLSDNDGRGYVEHIGWERHVNDPWSIRLRRKFRKWTEGRLRTIQR